MIERVSTHPGTALSLLVIAIALVIAGCGSGPEPQPTPTPNIPATVSAAVALALGTPVAQPTNPTVSGSEGPSLPRSTPDIEAVLDAAAADIMRTAVAKNPESLAFWMVANVEEAKSRLDHDPEVVNSRGRFGETPLHVAAGSNPNPEVIALLLDRGADIEAQSDKDAFPLPLMKTPLHSATGNRNPEAVALLLDSGADIMARDTIGRTPLHEAASDCAKPAVISLLLARGADARATTYQGQTACQLAIEPGLATLACDLNTSENISLLCK